MKSYTDLEQSKKLAEILPIESADQIWERFVIAGANLDVPDELQYKHSDNISFSYCNGIPCWSLSALLDVLPNGTNIIKEEADTENERYMCTVGTKKGIIPTFGNNPVDACFEMIIKLHK